MTFFRRFLRPMLLAFGLVGGLGLTGQAQAVVSVTPVLSSFDWSGLCLDCTAIGNPGSAVVSGTLVLQDYTLGQAIDESNFVSFSYGGSNLVDPFTVTRDSSVYWLAGSITPNPGPKRFEVLFDDGLHFQTQTDGSWSVCSRAPNGDYYGGTSCSFAPAVNNDFGISGTFGGVPAVPEPAEWALLLAGLGVIGLARRRRGQRAGA